MAYYDEPLVDPTLGYDAQEQAFAQQAARIKAMRAMAGAPIEAPGETGAFTLSTGQRIGGQQLKTPTAALLNPLINQVGADIGESRLNTARSEMDQRQQQDMMDILRQTPTGTPAQPGVTPATPMDDEGNPMPVIAPTAAVPPTREEVLAHAGKLMNLPKARKIGQEYLADQLIKEPEREETRAERVLTRTMAAEAARQKQKDDIEYRRWQQQQHNDTLRAVGSGHDQARKDAAASRAEAASSRGEGTWVVSPNLDADGESFMYNNKHPEQTRKLGAKPAAAAKPPKELTEGAKKEQNALLNSSRTYATAFDTYKDDYSGGLGASKAASVLGRYTPIGAETSQYWTPVNKVQAEANHQLYGASFTGAEQARADAYNPSEWKGREQNLSGMGQMAIDNGLAHVRANYLHNYPGSYVDNDGSVVLPDGRVVGETKSRLISVGEIKNQKLKPIPSYRDIEASAPKPQRSAPSGGGAAPRPAAGGAPPEPKVGDVVDGYRLMRPNYKDQTSWERIK